MGEGSFHSSERANFRRLPPAQPPAAVGGRAPVRRGSCARGRQPRTPQAGSCRETRWPVALTPSAVCNLPVPPDPAPAPAPPALRGAVTGHAKDEAPACREGARVPAGPQPAAAPRLLGPARPRRGPPPAHPPGPSPRRSQARSPRRRCPAEPPVPLAGRALSGGLRVSVQPLPSLIPEITGRPAARRRPRGASPRSPAPPSRGGQRRGLPRGG